MTNPFRDNHPLTDPTLIEELKLEGSWPTIREDFNLTVSLPIEPDEFFPNTPDLITRLIALADAAARHEGPCMIDPMMKKYLLLAADQLNTWQKYILKLEAQVMEYERLLDSPSKADPLD